MPGREATPPPVIGKVGRYTVFITPKLTELFPTPSPGQSLSSSSNVGPKLSPIPSPRFGPALTPKSAPVTPLSLPSKVPLSAPSKAPPVQVSPKQFESKPEKGSSGSVLGFFWDAMAKVQSAHSSLDEYLAGWFGLDQSKYQWALNDYYESKGVEKEGGEQKQTTTKGQTV